MPAQPHFLAVALLDGAGVAGAALAVSVGGFAAAQDFRVEAGAEAFHSANPVCAVRCFCSGS